MPRGIQDIWGGGNERNLKSHFGMSGVVKKDTDHSTNKHFTVLMV